MTDQCAPPSAVRLTFQSFLPHAESRLAITFGTPHHHQRGNNTVSWHKFERSHQPDPSLCRGRISKKKAKARGAEIVIPTAAAPWESCFVTELVDLNRIYVQMLGDGHAVASGAPRRTQLYVLFVYNPICLLSLLGGEPPLSCMRNPNSKKPPFIGIIFEIFGWQPMDKQPPFIRKF